MSEAGAPRNRTPMITAAVIAAVGAVAALVWYLVWGATEPSPQPTVTAATESAPESTPTPEPETPEPEPEPAMAFALTISGDLVELDPINGAVIRSVASSPWWRNSLVISPDRHYAYVDAFDYSEGGPGWPGQIDRISLVDGTVETVVTDATSPAISPDGRYLAYLSIALEAQGSVRSLTVMDLTTGSVTSAVPDDQCVECERVVGAPTWTPDSTSLILAVGWFDGFPGHSLVAVDPATTATLDSGRLIGPDNSGELIADWYGRTTFTAQGTLLIPAEEGTAAQWDAAAAYAFGDGPKVNQPAGLVAIVDVASGDVLDRIPVDGFALSVAAEPEGSALLIVSGSGGTDEVHKLYRWDGNGLTHIGDGYVAIAW